MPRTTPSTPPPPREDPYRVLGLPYDATADDVRTAFRRLARELHPDRNRRPDAAIQFQRAQAAYDTLRDPMRRAAVDAARAAPPPRAGARAVPSPQSPRTPAREAEGWPGGPATSSCGNRATEFDEAVEYFDQHFRTHGRPAPGPPPSHRSISPNPRPRHIAACVAGGGLALLTVLSLVPAFAGELILLAWCVVLAIAGVLIIYWWVRTRPSGIR
jgi:hypothetical protein